MLWDLAEGKRLYSLDAGDIIHALVFSPNRYWLCAATQVRGATAYRPVALCRLRWLRWLAQMPCCCCCCCAQKQARAPPAPAAHVQTLSSSQ